MKKLLAIVAVLLMAAPAVANDNLLSQLGLSGIQVVTADEASQVSGRGFVKAGGLSSVVGDWVGPITDGTFGSSAGISLEGIQAMLGAVSSAASHSIDESTDFDDGLKSGYHMVLGTLSVGSGSSTSGAAD